jgi:hypothetical protein
MIPILLSCNSGLEKELGELKDTAQYVMDLYVPQEEGAEPKPLIDRLDEAEGRIKGLLLDTANLAAVAALSTVKYYDVVAAAGRSRSLTSALTEVVLKGAFQTWVRSMSYVNKLAILKSFCLSRDVCMF